MKFNLISKFKPNDGTHCRFCCMLCYGESLTEDRSYPRCVSCSGDVLAVLMGWNTVQYVRRRFDDTILVLGRLHFSSPLPSVACTGEQVVGIG